MVKNLGSDRKNSAREDVNDRPHLQIKLSGTSHSAHDKQKTDAEEIKNRPTKQPLSANPVVGLSSQTLHHLQKATVEGKDE
jgi:hypothetical protein